MTVGDLIIVCGYSALFILVLVVAIWSAKRYKN